MDSPHPLKRWIEFNTTAAEFARAAKISESYLSEILNGRKSPSLGLAARLSRKTRNAVPITAFVKEAAE